MDEGNVSDDDTSMHEAEQTESAKRLKTDFGSVEKSEESSAKEGTSNSNTEPETASASTSSDSGFPRCRNFKNRNYRKSCDDNSRESNANDSTEDERENASQTEVDIMDRLSEISFATSEGSTASCSCDTGTESEPEVLKKVKPKHNWFVVPEIINRQLGARASIRNDIQFQRKCYGSMYCVEKLELMYKLEKHEGCVNCLNFSPDGSLLASGSDDLKVVIWDWKHGNPLLSFETKHRGNIFQSRFLSLSGDMHIVTAARDGQVRLHQVGHQEGLRSSRKLGCHLGPCHKLAVLKDQPHIIISVGEDALVMRHDIRNTKPDRIVNVKSDDLHEVALYSISSNPLNSYEFCVSGRDHIVRAYDQRKCGSNISPLYTWYPKKKKTDFLGLHVTCAVYNHDGSEILASYNDDDIYIFDTSSQPGTYKHTYQGHRNGATIKGVSYFGPKSEYVVSGSDCGYVYFWERESEAIVQWMLADDNGVVNCLEPHPKFPFICTSGLDWDIKVWVPSYEEKPSLDGLMDTVKANHKARKNLWSSTHTPDLSGSQILWMWWRRMRNSSRNRSREERGGGEERTAFLEALLSSSSSNSSNSDSEGSNNEMDDDDEHLDENAACTTS